MFFGGNNEKDGSRYKRLEEQYEERQKTLELKTREKYNPNELLYEKGRKHYSDVIKNRDTKGSLVYKAPEEDFNNDSVLIVNPGEVAIFVNHTDKMQLLVLPEGRHVLNTDNYPVLSRIVNRAHGGISSYNCKVYFFKTTDSREIKWGIMSPIKTIDRSSNLYVKIRARGVYRVKVENPELFLHKLIGNLDSSLAAEDLIEVFNTEIQMKAKTVLTQYVNNYESELIGIEEDLSKISDAVKSEVDNCFKEYGLFCVAFAVATMDVDYENYDALNDIQKGVIAKIREGQAEAQYINTLGDNWEKVQSAKIMNTLAANKSVSRIGNMGALGFGMTVAPIIDGAVDNLANTAVIGNPRMAREDEKNTDTDPFETLQKLKQMLDAELITKQEYDVKKNEILSKM